MKKLFAKRLQLMVILFVLISNSKTFGQLYTSVVQDFESGGNGTDGCWTGFNSTGFPTTNNFFTVTTPVRSGTKAGGFYACCGGAATNNPTYYISPVLPEGAHPVFVYVRQSSALTENFEIGTTSSALAANFTIEFTKSVWPSPVAWELISTNITTTQTSNRIAFRVPKASIKTYYIDSVVIGLAGQNTNPSCTYTITNSVMPTNEQNSLSVFPNPFEDVLYFENKNQEKSEFSLFDLSGKLILKKTVCESAKLETGPLTKGVYLYQLKRNQSILTGKLFRND
jgi:hypothetical protein